MARLPTNGHDAHPMHDGYTLCMPVDSKSTLCTHHGMTVPVQPTRDSYSPAKCTRPLCTMRATTPTIHHPTTHQGGKEWGTQVMGGPHHRKAAKTQAVGGPHCHKTANTLVWGCPPHRKSACPPPTPTQPYPGIRRHGYNHPLNPDVPGDSRPGVPKRSRAHLLPPMPKPSCTQQEAYTTPSRSGEEYTTVHSRLRNPTQWHHQMAWILIATLSTPDIGTSLHSSRPPRDTRYDPHNNTGIHQQSFINSNSPFSIDTEHENTETHDTSRKLDISHFYDHNIAYDDGPSALSTQTNTHNFQITVTSQMKVSLTSPTTTLPDLVVGLTTHNQHNYHHHD